MSLAFNRGSLQQRAHLFAKVRSFFAERSVLEVDTPILSPYAPVDAYIDVMEVDMGRGKVGFLHTSPEYGMKKLLAKGSGDIYQLGHVFRQDEEGTLHTPEFTMLEWYRVNKSLAFLIEETCDLIKEFLPNLPTQILSYRQAFLDYAGIDYLNDDLLPHLAPLAEDADSWDRDTQLNLLFSELVEPKLGKETLHVITNYPATQAALAKIGEEQGVPVALRFEVYVDGIELANGFDELLDAKEQKERLLKENQKREELGKHQLPIDNEFIDAVGKLPECVGVAVGFDRLMKLSTSSTRSSATSVQSENDVPH